MLDAFSMELRTLSFYFKSDSERASLPNKLFDYIHAGVPVLASNLLEVKNIIQQYEVGEIIDNHKPEHIAEKINTFFVDKNRIRVLKENCIIASDNLSWEKEEIKLIHVFKRYIHRQ